MRVLYVEDDASSARAVELMLCEVGHAYDQTDLGEQAIELAKTNDYDFILLDVMLPDIDGYEVIERLRAEGVSTPHLFQSGLVDRNSEFAGLAFGSSEYLVKPFTKTELVRQMEAVFARAKLSAGLPLQPQAGDFGGPLLADYDRRRHRRFKTIKHAWIDRGPRFDADARIDCMIIDLSHGGAGVRLPDDKTELPPTFDLELEAGPAFRCRLCWSQGNRAGIQFLEAYD